MMPTSLLVFGRIACLLLGLAGLVRLAEGIITLSAFDMADGGLSIIIAGLVFTLTVPEETANDR